MLLAKQRGDLRVLDPDYALEFANMAGDVYITGSLKNADGMNSHLLIMTTTVNDKSLDENPIPVLRINISGNSMINYDRLGGDTVSSLYFDANRHRVSLGIPVLSTLKMERTYPQKPLLSRFSRFPLPSNCASALPLIVPDGFPDDIDYASLLCLETMLKSSSDTMNLEIALETIGVNSGEFVRSLSTQSQDC